MIPFANICNSNDWFPLQQNICNSNVANILLQRESFPLQQNICNSNDWFPFCNKIFATFCNDCNKIFATVMIPLQQNICNSNDWFPFTNILQRESILLLQIFCCKGNQSLLLHQQLQQYWLIPFTTKYLQQ